jgi:hypothetical protein
MAEELKISIVGDAISTGTGGGGISTGAPAMSNPLEKQLDSLQKTNKILTDMGEDQRNEYLATIKTQKELKDQLLGKEQKQKTDDNAEGVAKGIGNFVKSGDLSTVGAVIGGAVGGSVGAAIGSALGDFLSFENLVGLIAAGVTAALLALTGPVGLLIAGGVFKGVTMGLENSETVQGIKKTLGQGLGAVVDSIIGLTYLFFQGGFFQELKSFILNPGDWIEDKLTMASIWAKTNMVTWTSENIVEPIKSALALGAISVRALFDIDEKDFADWVAFTIKHPIQGVLVGSIIVKDWFSTTGLAEFIEDTYDDYIKPVLKVMEPFADLFGGGYDVPEDLITLPKKDLEINIKPRMTIDKDSVEEFAKNFAEVGDKMFPGDQYDEFYNMIMDCWANIKKAVSNNV